jgi:hypothetical protein
MLISVMAIAGIDKLNCTFVQLQFYHSYELIENAVYSHVNKVWSHFAFTLDDQSQNLRDSKVRVKQSKAIKCLAAAHLMCLKSACDLFMNHFYL